MRCERYRKHEIIRLMRSLLSIPLSLRALCLLTFFTLGLAQTTLNDEIIGTDLVQEVVGEAALTVRTFATSDGSVYIAALVGEHDPESIVVLLSKNSASSIVWETSQLFMSQGSIELEEDFQLVDVNNDGFPELYWFEINHGNAVGDMHIHLLDLDDLLHYSVDIYLYEYSANIYLDATANEGKVAQFNSFIKSKIEETGYVTFVPQEQISESTVVKVEPVTYALNPNNLCKDYDSSSSMFLGEVSELVDTCDSKEITRFLESGSEQLNRFTEQLSQEPPKVNAVEALVQVKQFQDAIFYTVDGLERMGRYLPPGQAKYFKEWVMTDALIALLDYQDASDRFESTLDNLNLERQILEAKQICRVSGAPDWCKWAAEYSLFN